MMKNDVEEFKGNNLIRANKFDGGCDIKSAEDVLIKPKEYVIVGTGLHTAIPNGYVGLVRGRSSLAFKHGIWIFQGTLDSGWRGETKCILYNISNEPYKVSKGDRIAQLITVPVFIDNYIEYSELPEPNDGRIGGFGSSGK
jgi:dUTP pyrophosphatase